jgi:hypothetical protein
MLGCADHQRVGVMELWKAVQAADLNIQGKFSDARRSIVWSA